MWDQYGFFYSVYLCVSAHVYQNAGTGTGHLFQTGACSLYQRHSGNIHPHRNLPLLGKIPMTSFDAAQDDKMNKRNCKDLVAW